MFFVACKIDQFHIYSVDYILQQEGLIISFNKKSMNYSYSAFVLYFSRIIIFTNPYIFKVMNWGDMRTTLWTWPFNFLLLTRYLLRFTDSNNGCI